MVFEELGLAEPILRAVAREGYTDPTPIQTQAIPPLLRGRDLLGCAQTGTGKTAAFALPILHRLASGEAPPRGRRGPIRALIVTPTRELALQIDESFRAYGRHTAARPTVVFGGVNQNPQTRALARGADIVIATPGRLLDLMQQGFVDLGAVETFVLDEADRMLDMGFLPDVRRIVARLPARRQTVLFSATMPEPIERLAATMLRDPVRVRIAPVAATTQLIEQSVCFVPRPQKARWLAEFLGTRAVSRALVFTRTKHGADRVARQLKQSGIHADALHGNKSQSARQRTLDDFKAFRTHVLVATDIASRGIDVEGISHVLNYDLPHEPETYVHRIGRTGRAGASGIAVSLCDDEERKHLQAIERLLRRALPVQAPPSGGGQARTATRTQRQPQASQSQGNARPHRGQPGRKAPGKGTRGHGGGYRPHQKPRRADRRRTARTA